MRLKKIRLAGFKSFVDPTNIPFPGDMTAIVGPNGCGKSNVIDAVRWVLGESSAKNLRGDSMTDVIFNGSSARKPVSQCSVELVFDNSSGRVQGEYAGYNELSVKRVVTKDAVSSYLLNSAKCRRKDITDLFLGTGLGPRSYAIIEQGMISRLIESKPQELRVFIEEAAGISKYKERRRETQNRIQHTNDNLLRLEDVRQELGDQLAKLKRQAAAATRYKDLKKEERELKAFLATKRWLIQTDIIKQSDEKIAELNTELENVKANKQGDESGLQSLKNDQSIKKQNISDVQQKIYSIGTEITKIEQSQLFSKQRNSQIQAEIEQIEQSARASQSRLGNLSEEIELASEALIAQEPDKMMLEEQLDELKEKQVEAEEAIQSQQSEYKMEEQSFQQRKQQLQQLHGKIQQTVSLQQRTQSRLEQINQELSELTADEGADESDLVEKLELSRETLAQREDELSESRDSLQEIVSQRDDWQQHLNQIKSQQLAAKTQFDTLCELQKSVNSNELPEALQHIDSKNLWQSFTVPEKYTAALATVLGFYRNAQVLNTGSASIPSDTSADFLLAKEFTANKRPGTLASVIEQGSVPSAFNFIVLQHEDVPLQDQLDSIQPYESLISLNGDWRFVDAQFTKSSEEQARVERANRIRELRASLYEFDTTVAQAEQDLRETQDQVLDSRRKVEHVESLLSNAKKEYESVNNEVTLIKMRKEQNAARIARLQAEQEEQQGVLEEEQESLELLNEEIEDISLIVAELEDKAIEREQAKEQSEQALKSLNSQVQQIQTELHNKTMQLQQLQNSLQLLSEQKSLHQSSLEDSQEKLLILQEEAENLRMPAEEQSERLQALLEEKEALHAEQEDLNIELAAIEEQMAELEKGQAGVIEKMDKIKAQIEAERLHSESARVRAQSFIEQLAEMQQSIKTVLEDMPDDVDENAMQQRVEQIANALQRLGAVNLAAVEEYEEQNERKQTLDAQFDDLTGALETLENAMRKIDRETRSRFKETFDKVNEDLKMLFPKVFGGGSAYLALTDDDLLDTGVTIMARPPGKKNSTIQLLSGGEKALTALSLVFAIFRLNPAPFCLLDEVDAPLDDANVGRFCKLVSEMSQTVQFIYITHNKVAMEMATHLTGVTMSEPGVSRMVSVDMEQALAIAE